MQAGPPLQFPRGGLMHGGNQDSQDDRKITRAG